MRISKVRIRYFRSIKDLTISLDSVSAICGPNSAGKSNILRAIEFAFRTDISKEEIYANLTRSKRDHAGGPLLSIYVDIDFINVNTAVAELAKIEPGGETRYSFRAVRSGTVSRKIGDKSIDDLSTLSDHFSVVYVPPIRDLTVSGLDPFKALFSRALRRARGQQSLRQAEETVKEILLCQAGSLLRDQQRVAETLLDAEELTVNTNHVSLEDLYERVSLMVQKGGYSIPLSELGTGHQSAVVVNLYWQLGEQSPGETVLLLEEPDNHLHPSTVRAVAQDLLELGKTTQVILTTHSPILLAALGLRLAKPVKVSEKGLTVLRNLDLNSFEESKIRRTLNQFNLRATEPLVSGSVILCEGPLDAAVISTLVECERGKSADELGLTVIQAGGKHPLITLARFLTSLGADWTAVMDWDAAYNCEFSRIRRRLTIDEANEALQAIPAIEAILETEHKRGKKILKGLQGVTSELQNERLSPTIYDGSPLQDLMSLKTASTEAQRKLKEAFQNQQLRAFRIILEKHGLWLWARNLEETLLQRAGSEAVLEQSLIELGVLTQSVPERNRRSHLKNLLKDLANRPYEAGEVIIALKKAGCFSRTEVNRGIRALLKFS